MSDDVCESVCECRGQFAGCASVRLCECARWCTFMRGCGGGCEPVCLWVRVCVRADVCVTVSVGGSTFGPTWVGRRGVCECACLCTCACWMLFWGWRGSLMSLWDEQGGRGRACFSQPGAQGPVRVPGFAIGAAVRSDKRLLRSLEHTPSRQEGAAAPRSRQLPGQRARVPRLPPGHLAPPPAAPPPGGPAPPEHPRGGGAGHHRPARRRCGRTRTPRLRGLLGPAPARAPPPRATGTEAWSAGWVRPRIGCGTGSSPRC